MVLAFLFALTIPVTGVVHLPAGVTTVRAEIRLPAGAHDLKILGDHATLRAAANFRGRAILSCQGCQRVEIRDLAIDGNREALEKPMELPASNQTFAGVFPNNGLLFEDAEDITVDRVNLANIANFAILVNRSREVSIKRVTVKDSGSRNAKGRNNTTGGILFEEGAEAFFVVGCTFSNIRGNAVWTHSRSGSPRNEGGTVVANQFHDIGRDAIQVGHATGMQVVHNVGERIGMNVALVDVEGGGTPVAIDTAGNVENSTYRYNEFQEINGKCIDLDGFHDGFVLDNKCINHGRPEEYPFGHFGIVFNNANREMQSENIDVERNELEGMKFGGIFVIGSGHRIRDNRLLHINTAHCNENAKQFGCAVLGEPNVLDTGIYLGSHAEHPALARGNVIEGNTISGWKMKTRCIQAAPGVKLADNEIKNNTCTDE